MHSDLTPPDNVSISPTSFSFIRANRLEELRCWNGRVDIEGVSINRKKSIESDRSDIDLLDALLLMYQTTVMLFDWIMTNQ